VHQAGSSGAQPLASMFKLFVLGALAHQIAAGRVSWNQELTVTAAVKSGGSGSLQDVPAGTRIPVRQTAAKMISISDNTAADMLIHLVGRPAVQAQDRQWSGYAGLNVPFLTTRELFLLKIHPALASRYLSLAPGERGVPGLLGRPAAVQPGTNAEPGNIARRHRDPRMVRLTG
jgi:beta-lactamase class A